MHFLCRVYFSQKLIYLAYIIVINLRYPRAIDKILKLARVVLCCTNGMLSIGLKGSMGFNLILLRFISVSTWQKIGVRIVLRTFVTITDCGGS